METNGTGPEPSLLARSASLVQALTALSQEDFLHLMRQIYASLLASLRGAKVQSQLIAQIVGQQTAKG